MRTWWTVCVVVFCFLAARQTSARQPCRIMVEDLELTLQEVRIDGAVATETSFGLYAVDGGPAVQVNGNATVVLTDDTLTAPRCTRLGSRTIATTLLDPFTGASGWLDFQVVP